jgi:2-polyprenyl-3-methyl-5-hydroxy-6-metoxy-1,4-benzoquinol methylase
MPASLSVIVPVFNEQFLVGESLDRLRVLGESPLLDRVKVIVVDDCSRDETPAVLQRFQQSVRGTEGKMEWVFLRHWRNQGKGGALRTGLAEADTELTVFHDADLEYFPRDLLKMIPLFSDQDADAVFGSRFLSGEFRRVLFFRHSLGNHLLTFLCNLLSDLNLTDMETCYKMARTELLKTIPLESNDFRIEPELTLKLAKRGARLFEVPVSYAGRTYQDGKKIGWRDGVLALWAILKFALSDHIYTEDEYGSQILARLGRAPRFTQWMADAVKPHVGREVLEIGAGIGNLTVNLIPRSLYWATDANPLYMSDLRHLRKTRPYLHTGIADVTRAETFPPNQRFDTVICLNVLEHVEDDLTALRNIAAALEEGGRAIVLVPQGPGLYGSLDVALGHRRRYTRAQIAALSEEAGLKVVNILGFNQAGVPAWLLNGRVLRRKTFGLWQIEMLNLLVPVFRRLDGWIPLPYLSVIAVLQK